jgi:hypothetical protein
MPQTRRAEERTGAAPSRDDLIRRAAVLAPMLQAAPRPRSWRCPDETIQDFIDGVSADLPAGVLLAVYRL